MLDLIGRVAKANGVIVSSFCCAVRYQLIVHALHFGSCNKGNETRDASSDCVWSEWSTWSKCTVTCGRGVHVRHRAINHTSLSSNDSRCPSADSIQEKPCSFHVDCYFGRQHSSCLVLILFGERPATLLIYGCFRLVISLSLYRPPLS